MDEWLSRVASDPGFIVAVVSVVVNGFAPTVARRFLRTSPTPDDWQPKDWLQQVMDSAKTAAGLEEQKNDLPEGQRLPTAFKVKLRRNREYQYAYALMDYFAQVVATTIAIFFLLGEALVLIVERVPTEGAWLSILVLCLSLLFWFFLFRTPTPDLSKFLPKVRSQSFFSSVFGPPPPDTALKWVRYVAGALTIGAPVIVAAIQPRP